MADDPGSKAFCNGLTETLTAKLTQLTGNYPLQVVPTSEIRAEGVTSVEQARKIFGVGLVLEGSLHGSGGQVRVTYTLVDAKANRQLDAQSFDADVSDAFAVEDRVVDGTLRMLGLSVQGNDRVVLAAHGTADPSAYDQFLRGRGYLLDYHKHENIDSAISAFNRALTLDPKYAEAYAALGKAYWLGYGKARAAGSGWRRPGRLAIRPWPNLRTWQMAMPAWAMSIAGRDSTRKQWPSSRRLHCSIPQATRPSVDWPTSTKI